MMTDEEKYNFINGTLLGLSPDEYSYENYDKDKPYITDIRRTLSSDYSEYLEALNACYNSGIDFDISDYILKLFNDQDMRGGFVERICDFLNAHPATKKAKVTFDKEMLMRLRKETIKSGQASGTMELFFVVLPAKTFYNNSKGGGDITLKTILKNIRIEIKSCEYRKSNAPTLCSPDVIDNNINNEIKSRFKTLLDEIAQKLPASDRLKAKIKEIQDENAGIAIGYNVATNQRKYIHYDFYKVTHDVMCRIYSSVEDIISKKEFNARIYIPLKKFIYDVYVYIIPNNNNVTFKKNKTINNIDSNKIIDLVEDMLVDENEFNCFDETSYLIKGKQAAILEKIKRGECCQADELYCLFSILYIRKYMDNLDYIFMYDLKSDRWCTIRKDDSDEDIMKKLIFIYPDIEAPKCRSQRCKIRALINQL